MKFNYKEIPEWDWDHNKDKELENLSEEKAQRIRKERRASWYNWILSKLQTEIHNREVTISYLIIFYVLTITALVLSLVT